MIKNTTHLLILFLTMSLFMANEALAKKMLIPNADVPLELGFIIRTLQEQNLASFEEIYPHVLIIDKYAQLMPKEDIFLLGKIEVYKTLVKNDKKPIRTPITEESAGVVKAALAKTAHPFIKWFLQALYKDIQNLMREPYYGEYLIQKSNNLRLEKIEIRRIDKKSELLQQWVSIINPQIEDASDILLSALKIKMLEALKNTALSFKMIFIQTDDRLIEAALKNELKFFSIQEIKPKKSPILIPKETPKSVEDIIDPIILKREELPQPSTENWLDENKLSEEMKNLPNPANDARVPQDF